MVLPALLASLLTKIFSILVYHVSIVFLDMRINDGHHFASFAGYVVDHLLSMAELIRIPCEVFLSICVFNIKPDDIHGDVVFVKLGVNLKVYTIYFSFNKILERRLVHHCNSNGTDGKRWRRLEEVASHRSTWHTVSGHPNEKVRQMQKCQQDRSRTWSGHRIGAESLQVWTKWDNDIWTGVTYLINDRLDNSRRRSCGGIDPGFGGIQPITFNVLLLFFIFICMSHGKGSLLLLTITTRK